LRRQWMNQATTFAGKIWNNLMIDMDKLLSLCGWISQQKTETVKMKLSWTYRLKKEPGCWTDSDHLTDEWSPLSIQVNVVVVYIFCWKNSNLMLNFQKKVMMNFYRVVSSAGSNRKATRTRRKTETVTHPISSQGWGIWTRCRRSCRARPRREKKAEFAFHLPFAPFTVDEPLMVIVTWHLLAASVSSF
jgi:hypothetical protein